MKSAATTPNAPRRPRLASRTCGRLAGNLTEKAPRASQRLSSRAKRGISLEIHPLVALYGRALGRRGPPGAGQAPLRLFPAERLRVAVLRYLGNRSEERRVVKECRSRWA